MLHRTVRVIMCFYDCAGRGGEHLNLSTVLFPNSPDTSQTVTKCLEGLTASSEDDLTSTSPPATSSEVELDSYRKT